MSAPLVAYLGLIAVVIALALPLGEIRPNPLDDKDGKW